MVQPAKHELEYFTLILFDKWNSNLNRDEIERDMQIAKAAMKKKTKKTIIYIFLCDLLRLLTGDQ